MPLKKDQFKSIINSGVSELYSSGLMVELQTMLRDKSNSFSLDEGPKKANKINQLLKDVVKKLEAAFNGDVIKEQEDLKKLCEDVSMIIAGTKYELSLLLHDTGKALWLITSSGALTKMIEDIYSEKKEEVNTLIDFPKGFSVDGGIERLFIEDPKLLKEMLEKQLWNFLFKSSVDNYMLRLLENYLFPLDENISERDYDALKAILEAYKHAVRDWSEELMDGLRYSGRGFGPAFDNLKDSMGVRLNRVFMRTEKNKVYRTEDEAVGEELLRTSALDSIMESLESLENLSEKDFLEAGEDYDFSEFLSHGLEDIDFILLKEKAKKIKEMDNEGQDIEEESTISTIDDLSKAETVFASALQEKHEGKKLNFKKRRQISTQINSAIHGGLNFRRAKDINKIFELVQKLREEKEAAAHKEVLLKAKFNEGLIRHVYYKYIATVCGVLIVATKKFLAKKQSVDPSCTIPDVGEPIKAFVSTGGILVEDWIKEESLNGELCDTERLRCAFERKRMPQSFIKDQANELYERLREQMPELSEDCGETISSLEIDTEYVIENLGKEKTMEISMPGWSFEPGVIA